MHGSDADAEEVISNMQLPEPQTPTNSVKGTKMPAYGREDGYASRETIQILKTIILVMDTRFSMKNIIHQTNYDTWCTIFINRYQKGRTVEEFKIVPRQARY